MHSSYADAAEHLDLQEFKIGIAPFKPCQQLARDRLEIWKIVSHSEKAGIMLFSVSLSRPCQHCPRFIDITTEKEGKQNQFECKWNLGVSKHNSCPSWGGISLIPGLCEFLMWFFRRAISWDKFPHRLQENDKEWADVSGVWGALL